MADALSLIKGIIIGIAVAAPLGPINLLVVNRTLRSGRLMGIVSGVGAAVTDGFYGGVAAFGVSLVSQFLLSKATWLGLVGGLALIGLGVKTIVSRPRRDETDLRTGDYVTAFTSTLSLNLLSPVTIVTFAALIAALGSLGFTASGFVEPLLISIGIFLGSTSFVVSLVFSVGWLRAKLSDRWLRILDDLAGAALICFGLLTLTTIVL